MKKLALVALLMAIPTMAHAKTLEDLLVEKGVISANEARATAGAENTKVYWNEGTRLEFPDNGFTTNVSTIIKSSYRYTKVSKALKRAGGAENTSSFGVDQASLTLSGTALNQEFSYRLEAEFSGDKYSDGEDNDANFTDAYIQWEPCEGMGMRMGRFNAAISRQANAEDYALQIPVKSVISDTHEWGRQSGIRAFYSDLDQTYAVYGSMYNGADDTESYVGRNTDHAFDVAVRANVLGKMNPFEEGDIDFTEELALNVGAAYGYAKDSEEALRILERDIHAVNVDVNAKVQGFSFAGEFFWTKSDYDDLGDTKNIGFYTQIGYFLTPEFEVAARYGYMDCDDANDGVCALKGFTPVGGFVDDVNEAALSLNYYFWKRNLKAQVAYVFQNQDLTSRTKDYFDNDNINTNVWMFQISTRL